jgi:hypothetical protein
MHASSVKSLCKRQVAGMHAGGRMLANGRNLGGRHKCTCMCQKCMQEAEKLASDMKVCML